VTKRWCSLVRTVRMRVGVCMWAGVSGEVQDAAGLWMPEVGIGVFGVSLLRYGLHANPSGIDDAIPAMRAVAWRWISRRGAPHNHAEFGSPTQ